VDACSVVAVDVFPLEIYMQLLHTASPMLLFPSVTPTPIHIRRADMFLFRKHRRNVHKFKGIKGDATPIPNLFVCLFSCLDVVSLPFPLIPSLF
jgi:hypothetical protein